MTRLTEAQIEESFRNLPASLRPVRGTKLVIPALIGALIERGGFEAARDGKRRKVPAILGHVGGDVPAIWLSGYDRGRKKQKRKRK